MVDFSDLVKNVSDSDNDEFNTFLDDVKNVKNKKELKKLKKSVIKKYRAKKVNELIDKKQKFANDLESFENEFLYKDGFLTRIRKKFSNKAIIQCIFIQKDMSTKTKNLKITDVNSLMHKNKSYNIVTKCFVRLGNKPTLFYYEGNPNPIFYDSEAHGNRALISPESLHSIHQANIVKQLFKVDGLSAGAKLGLGAGAIFVIGIIILALVGQLSDAAGLTNALLLIPINKRFKK